MKIGILGTRGIPNHYGGFEELATRLSEGLVQKGHSVTVYNSHTHPYKESTYNGVSIHHCYDAEAIIGTAGQFLYDLNCISHARTKKFDVLLFLGYTSSSVWSRIFPAGSVIISNMDGMEWKRSKYNMLTRSFLRFAERLAINSSDKVIADSIWIKKYLDEKYSIKCSHISYGADTNVGIEVPSIFSVAPDKYDMLVARMEKENNIEMILDGYLLSERKTGFLVVGNTSNSYGKFIRRKYASEPSIIFVGGIYDKRVLYSLIAKSRLYFHGHSVGGTNPSLLEAMAVGALVVAHDNPFNRTVLDRDDVYFDDLHSVKSWIDNPAISSLGFIKDANKERIASCYQWEDVITKYELLFIDAIKEKQQLMAEAVHQFKF